MNPSENPVAIIKMICLLLKARLGNFHTVGKVIMMRMVAIGNVTCMKYDSVPAPSKNLARMNPLAMLSTKYFWNVLTSTWFRQTNMRRIKLSSGKK